MEPQWAMGAVVEPRNGRKLRASLAILLGDICNSYYFVELFIGSHSLFGFGYQVFIVLSLWIKAN